MVIAPIIQTFAIAITAYYASRGLRAWRWQLIGKRKIEIAEETLVATYKVRSLFYYIRSPGAFGGEGTSRKRADDEKPGLASLKDSYFVPIERIQKTSDDFARLEKARLLCEVYFGARAGDPFDVIMRLNRKVAVSAQMLLVTVGEGLDSSTNRERWEADIWHGASSQGTDPIEAAVDAAVVEIEALCRPHLKSADGSQWWQRCRELASRWR